MNMKNGIFTAAKTDDGVKCVFIPQEVAEFASLNAKTAAQRKAHAEAEQAQRSRAAAVRAGRKAQEKARESARERTAARALAWIGGMSLAAILYAANMVAFPVVMGAAAVAVGAVGYLIGSHAARWEGKR